MSVHKLNRSSADDREPRRRIGRPRSVSDDAVFDVISEVIARDGPTGLSLNAIGEPAGLSAPALIQRFGSKRGLLLAFAARGQNFVNDSFDQARKANDSHLRALKAALEALTTPVRTRESLANNLAFLQMDLVDEDLRRHAIAQSRQLRRRIHQLLHQAGQHGELTGQTDIGSLTQSVYITYNGALITWAIDGKGTLRHWLRQSLNTTLTPHTARSTERAGRPSKTAEQNP